MSVSVTESVSVAESVSVTESVPVAESVSVTIVTCGVGRLRVFSFRWSCRERRTLRANPVESAS